MKFFTNGIGLAVLLFSFSADAIMFRAEISEDDVVEGRLDAGMPIGHYHNVTFSAVDSRELANNDYAVNFEGYEVHWAPKESVDKLKELGLPLTFEFELDGFIMDTFFRALDDRIKKAEEALSETSAAEVEVEEIGYRGLGRVHEVMPTADCDQIQGLPRDSLISLSRILSGSPAFTLQTSVRQRTRGLLNFKKLASDGSVHQFYLTNTASGEVTLVRVEDAVRALAAGRDPEISCESRGTPDEQLLAGYQRG